MIIRSSLTCDTCGQLHTVRIGMGQEDRQSHRFPCRQCGEDIVVGLEIDYVNISAQTVFEKNCTSAEGGQGSEVVNLDANFVIPIADQGKDMHFPRLPQFHAMMRKAEQLGATFTEVALDDPRLQQRPMRRPDFQSEWQEIKRAWSLHRRDKHIFAKPIIKKASATLYADDPLQDLSDWLFRFSMTLCGRAERPRLEAALAHIRGIDPASLGALKQHYNKHMAPNRGRKYLGVLTQYFEFYSEFAQVQFLVTGAVPPSYDDPVASTDFEKTRMFYGNAFESFADLMDWVAVLNNVSRGRSYDQFQNLILKQYHQIDKAGRGTCFADEPVFAAFTSEFDNQVRNASHHDGMEFDSQTQIITYRAGKGGSGPPHQMSYTEYLVRCVNLFVQLLQLLQLELLWRHDNNLKPPL